MGPPLSASLLPDSFPAALFPAEGVLARPVVGLARPLFLTGAGLARPLAVGAFSPEDILLHLVLMRFYVKQASIYNIILIHII